MISSDRPITWSKPLRMPAGEDKTGHKLIDSERVCVCVCAGASVCLCTYTTRGVSEAVSFSCYHAASHEI